MLYTRNGIRGKNKLILFLNAVVDRVDVAFIRECGQLSVLEKNNNNASLLFSSSMISACLLSLIFSCLNKLIVAICVLMDAQCL